MCPTLESYHRSTPFARIPTHSPIQLHIHPIPIPSILTSNPFKPTKIPPPRLPPTYPLPSTLYLPSSLAPQTPFLASAYSQPRPPSLQPTHLHKSLAEHTNAPAANHSAHRRNKKEAHILPSYPISIFARAVALKSEECDLMGSHRSGDSRAEQSIVGKKIYT